MTITATRYCTVNGVPLDTYAWRVPHGGYDQVLDGKEVRGGDLTMPTAAGERAYPRVLHSRVFSIPLIINGALTEAGGANSDPIAGMLGHQAYLIANLGYPGTSGVDATRGTVPFTFVRAGALATLTAQVTFLGLKDWKTMRGGLASARIDLKLPSGVLA